ncbi:MAG: prepilin-type N-terminal cleavage/methylation domain-containing protein [Planctomycetota bacterium]|nr:MAG: prepilin-type N-terminal cleavage/methylation domain-containing protein [Planctomycetota bacterium]
MRNQKGFTLIELMIVIAIIAIIAAIAIPNLLDARKGANEAAAKSALRTLFTVQNLYREGDRDGNGTLDYADTLTKLLNANLIDEVLASGTKQGYVFTINGASLYTWSATANPEVPGKSGDNYFFIDETGVIRYNTTGTASASDPPIGK